MELRWWKIGSAGGDEEETENLLELSLNLESESEEVIGVWERGSLLHFHRRKVQSSEGATIRCMAEKLGCRRRRRRTDGEDGTDKESAAVKKDKESEEVRKQQPEKAEGIEAEEEEA